jgi:NTP pyrophosphatase (non-canonical NTP hydrolase)
MTDKTSEILSILQEECAEVIQAISKINRFGLDGVNPSTSVSNRDSLINEIGDTMAMVYCLINVTNFITEEEIAVASDAKLNKLKTWSNIFKDQ